MAGVNSLVSGGWGRSEDPRREASGSWWGGGKEEDPDGQLFTERCRNISAFDNQCCHNTDGDQLDTSPCQNPVPGRMLSPQKELSI